MNTLTIDCYNDNAAVFVENTRNVDFQLIQDKFLAFLPYNLFDEFESKNYFIVGNL